MRARLCVILQCSGGGGDGQSAFSFVVGVFSAHDDHDDTEEDDAERGTLNNRTRSKSKTLTSYRTAGYR